MAKQLDTLKEMSQVLDKTEEAIQKYYDAVEQLPKKDAKILEDFKKVRDTLNKDSFQWTQEEFAIFDEADTKRKEALRTALVDREKFSKEE